MIRVVTMNGRRVRATSDDGTVTLECPIEDGWDAGSDLDVWAAPDISSILGLTPQPRPKPEP